MKAEKGGNNGNKTPKPNTQNQAKQPAKLSIKEQKKEMAAMTEKIKELSMQSRYFEVNVPTLCLTEVIEWFAQIKGLAIITTFPSAKSSETTLAIESNIALNDQLIRLGSDLKDIEIKAMGLHAQKTIKKMEADVTPISLTFEKAVGIAMWEEITPAIKERTKLLGKYSAIDGNSVQLKFDISDCVGKDALVRRIASIMEYADFARGNLQNQHEMNFVHGCIAESKKLLTIQKTAIRFEEVTGKQLIDMGKANVLNSTAKGASFFQRILNWFSAKRNYTYYYFDRVVEPNHELYIIEVDNPIPSTDVNHEEEIWLRYKFGNQFYRGFGVQLVQHYFNEMRDIHNARIKEMESDAKKFVPQTSLRGV